VRPDKHVGWRSMGLPEDPERSLREAMSSLLGRGDGQVPTIR
jgi:2,4-dichlorophenol 6-monooxygenase